MRLVACSFVFFGVDIDFGVIQIFKHMFVNLFSHIPQGRNESGVHRGINNL